MVQEEGMDLTEQQWELVKPFFEWEPQPDPHRHNRRGRPKSEARALLEGVLWILRTGASWRDLPARYGPYQTCHQRFQEWVREGILEGALWALAEDLVARGELELGESFIDGTFVAAKKGALQLVQQSGAKGARSWQSRTALVFLSPYGLQALRHMSVNSSKLPSKTGS